jgi:hypothetical protein
VIKARRSASSKRAGWRCLTDKQAKQLAVAFSMPFALTHHGGQVKPVFRAVEWPGATLVVAALAIEAVNKQTLHPRMTRIDANSPASGTTRGFFRAVYPSSSFASIRVIRG